MNTLPIKALYKAVTTSKNYIIVEDISTNFIGYKYTATDNEMIIDKALKDETNQVISTEYYGDNLQALENEHNNMLNSWTQNCYYYDWTEFLKRYDLSEYQVTKIKQLINKG